MNTASIKSGVKSLQVFGFLLSAAFALAQNNQAMANLKAKYPPIGQMVDVGGYKLHLDCQGRGSPTVVLEAGNGNSGLYWSLVQPEIAKTNRVCVYDRAGYGWSDKSPKPHSFGVMVEELHTLLGKAKVDGPYVLVGHSLGGIIVRQYAQQYPKEVAGLVLVDSSTEGQMERFPGAFVKLMSTEQQIQQLRQYEAMIASGAAAQNPDAAVPLEPRLPKQAAEASRALLLSDPKQIAAVRGELETIVASRFAPLPKLGNLKLMVLSQGQGDPMPPQFPAEVVKQYQQSWAQLQDELAELSSNSKHIIADKSGHDIPLDQPELVIAAIREAAGK